MPILFGTGRNGKSTFVDAILNLLGPDYSTTATRQLMMSNANTHPTERADLFGKRFVATVESGESVHLDEAAVKELVSGDKIKARRMRQDFFEFQQTHTLWMATNHLPRVSGNDLGIWRRLKVVPFLYTIPEHLVDQTLSEKLRQPDELSGILNWAIAGCKLWQEDMEIKAPGKVLMYTDEYRANEDILGQFMEDCCDNGMEYRVNSSDLYKAYRLWSEAMGHRSMSHTSFSRKIKERDGIIHEKTRKGRFFIGLQVNSEYRYKNI